MRDCIHVEEVIWAPLRTSAEGVAVDGVYKHSIPSAYKDDSDE